MADSWLELPMLDTLIAMSGEATFLYILRLKWWLPSGGPSGEIISRESA